MEVASGTFILSADPRLMPTFTGKSMEHALRSLVQADSDEGIFTYDYRRIAFYQVANPDEPFRFTLQLLERRADRPKEPLNSCPLDLAEVRAKDHQHWFTFELSGREWSRWQTPTRFFALT